MDEKYLSVPEVVNLSESFVCARLLSYESAAEAEFLTGIFGGRNGELENTVFCILDSDGETALSRAGRSPDFLKPGREAEVEDLVQAMERALRRHKSTKRTAIARSLPLAVDLRRAVNTAACDGLLVVALRAAVDDTAFVASLWKEALAGEAIFVRLDEASWNEVGGATDGNAVLVLEPDRFGQDFEIIARHATLDASSVEWLATHISSHVAPTKSSREHVRAGRRAGQSWETEIPVTDSEGSGRRNPR